TIERAVIMSSTPLLSANDFQIKKQAINSETIDDSWDTSTLHDIEKNIYSLISKLTPDFPCEEQALRLFPAQTI
ncbi:MAG: hypothetical protein AAGG81_03020, partial [Chlamydiota bacterium]